MSLGFFCQLSSFSIVCRNIRITLLAHFQIIILHFVTISHAYNTSSDSFNTLFFLMGHNVDLDIVRSELRLNLIYIVITTQWKLAIKPTIQRKKRGTNNQTCAHIKINISIVFFFKLYKNSNWTSLKKKGLREYLHLVLQFIFLL